MRTIRLIGLVALMGIGVQAQDTFTSWEGGVSDHWTVAENWQNDTVPSGAGATARVWNDTNSVPSVPNNTVLYDGEVASLKNVWVGNSGNAQQSGNLTLRAGSSLTTTDNFILENESRLSSSGTINVGNGNGLLVRDESVVTLRNGSSLNKLFLQNESSATLESGSYVGEISLLSDSAHLTMNTTYDGNISLFVSSSVTLNGTLNGDMILASTAMSSVGAAGVVNGNVEVGTGDSLTVAGLLQNGVFNVNGTGQAVIESTAEIYSASDNSWIYNDASVTWNVGADGSIGTLLTSRNESSAGAWDGEWRYTGSGDLMVLLDDYDAETYGTNVSLRLVGNIQNENDFGANVRFLLNGEELNTFTYDSNGTFIGSVIPEPSTVGLFALCSVCGLIIRRFRI